MPNTVSNVVKRAIELGSCVECGADEGPFVPTGEHLDGAQLFRCADGCTPAVAVKPTVNQIFDTPPPELCRLLGVELMESSIDDPEFFGAIVVRRNSSTILMLPAGRDSFETDCVARSLIAEAFGVDLQALPFPFETTSYPLLEGVPTIADSDPDMDEALRPVRTGGTR